MKDAAVIQGIIMEISLPSETTVSGRNLYYTNAIATWLHEGTATR
jgi:hypothetical protein